MRVKKKNYIDIPYDQVLKEVADGAYVTCINRAISEIYPINNQHFQSIAENIKAAEKNPQEITFFKEYEYYDEIDTAHVGVDSSTTTD